MTDLAENRLECRLPLCLAPKLLVINENGLPSTGPLVLKKKRQAGLIAGRDQQKREVPPIHFPLDIVARSIHRKKRFLSASRRKWRVVAHGSAVLSSSFPLRHSFVDFDKREVSIEKGGAAQHHQPLRTSGDSNSMKARVS